MGTGSALRGTRFLLLIGILAVSGLTLASFLARKRLRSNPPPLPPKMAQGIDQQTQSFSLSRSLGGKALYKIQASQVTNFKDTGKTLLHNVSIQIFGRDGDREDRITAEECEFDQASGSLFIPGEVALDIEAPPSDGTKAQGPSNPIHILTSALTFNQNTGVAATEKEVQFRFTGGEGSSTGAIYNPQDRTITLNSAARMSLSRPEEEDQRSHEAGKNQPIPPDAASKAVVAGAHPDDLAVTHVSASSLRFAHNEHKISLAAPVEITQGIRQIRAGNTEVFLDEQQHAQRASLGGGVTAFDRDPRRPTEVEASRGEFEFTQKGGVRAIVLEGGDAPRQDGRSVPLALWATVSGQSIQTGRAKRVEMTFDESSGHLSRVNADGEVRVALSPSPPPVVLPSLGEVQRNAMPPPGGSRILLAKRAELYLQPNGETLRQIRARTSSTIQLFPLKPGEEKRTIQGEEIDMQFSPEGELSELTADQNVRLLAEGGGKASGNRSSTSDHLSSSIDRRTHSVSRMKQWGNFSYQDSERQARARQADYLAEGDVIVLEGEPLVWNQGGKLSAEKISLFDSTGDVKAERKVSTTYYPSPSAGNPKPDPVHAVADLLDYNTRTQKAVYQGNARMWQASDLLEAGWLEFDRQKHTLDARNKVYSVFPGRSQPEGKKPTLSAGKEAKDETVSGPVEIRADSLSYKEGEQRAVYQGAVRMQNPATNLTSKNLEIFFRSSETPKRDSSGAPPDMEIEKAIATGEVRIEQAERVGTGDRVEYIPSESKMTLEGNLAAISDPQKGNTQGVRLTYFTRDDRILVQGEPGSPAQTRRPVQKGSR